MKAFTQRAFLFSTVVLLSVSSVQASNWYLNGDAGGALQQDVYDKSDGGTLSFDPGLRADVALGYNINDSFAVELESGVIWNSVDALSGTPLSTYGQSADLYQIPIMLKGIYHLRTGKFVHYVGVGVGGVASIFDLTSHISGPNGSDADFTFGYQAEAGVKYMLSDRASIGIGYKFLGTLEHSWTLETFNLKTDPTYTHVIFASFNWSL